MGTIALTSVNEREWPLRRTIGAVGLDIFCVLSDRERASTVVDRSLKSRKVRVNDVLKLLFDGSGAPPRSRIWSCLSGNSGFALRMDLLGSKLSAGDEGGIMEM